MSTLLIQPIITALVDIVSKSPGQRVLGARLGALLKISIPEFAPTDFQCRGLRQFLKTYASSDIEEKGRSGPDLLYGLANSPKPLQSSFPVPATNATFVPPPTSAYNWRAFTNPSYPAVLAVNRETGALQVVPLGTHPSEPWTALPKPTSEDHLEIARAFLSTLDESQRSALELQMSDRRWYMTFSTAAKKLGISGAWGTFRTTQLRSRFEEAIREAGVSEKPAVAKKTESFSYTKSSTEIKETELNPEASDSHREIRFRRLLAALITEMPISELRQLRLPVGEVFDFLIDN